MKIRNGFVSNSSSSSFAIKLEDLTPLQIALIKGHYQASHILHETGLLTDCCEVGEGDEWMIQILDKWIIGSTDMDNFDMHHYLRTIGVNVDNTVRWNDMACQI